MNRSDFATSVLLVYQLWQAFCVGYLQKIFVLNFYWKLNFCRKICQFDAQWWLYCMSAIVVIDWQLTHWTPGDFQTHFSHWDHECFRFTEVNAKQPHFWNVNLCSDNGLVPDGTAPLFAPMLIEIIFALPEDNELTQMATIYQLVCYHADNISGKIFNPLCVK